MFIEVKYIKDAKGVAQQRLFITYRGHRGSINITCGDCTRVGEEPPYEKPFLGREPAAHPDSGPDCTTLGALTIVPDQAESNAWVKFNRWIKQEILRIGAIKNNKGKVVTAIEELELVCKDLIIEPVEGDDKRKNVCFWQKFQSSDKPGLSTTYSRISCEPDASGKPVVYEHGDFDPKTLKAGSQLYTVISVGELKKAPTGWGICLYTRKVYVDLHSEHDGVGSEPVVVFGGVRVVSVGGAGSNSAATISAATISAATISAGVSDAVQPQVIETQAGIPADTLNDSVLDTGLAAAESVSSETKDKDAVVGDKRAAELVPGIESDVSGLAAAIAKIRDPEQKRQKRA